MAFEAVLLGFGVWVFDPEGIAWLVRGGFGKGILSRSQPSFFRTGGERAVSSGEKSVLREPFHAKRAAPRLKSGLDGGVEQLQVSFLECFFLHDTTESLSIRLGDVLGTPRGEPLSKEDLWSALVTRGGERFVIDYCAYCHYRTMGWVVRGGLKYGVDFILYSKGGPLVKHGELAVRIQVEGSEPLPDGSPSTTFLTADQINRLSDLQSLSRVTETVSKGLLLCLVSWEEGGTSPTWSSPSIMSKMKIKDHIVRRWDPSKTRE